MPTPDALSEKDRILDAVVRFEARQLLWWDTPAEQRTQSDHLLHLQLEARLVRTYGVSAVRRPRAFFAMEVEEAARQLYAALTREVTHA